MPTALVQYMKLNINNKGDRWQDEIILWKGVTESTWEFFSRDQATGVCLKSQLRLTQGKKVVAL